MTRLNRIGSNALNQSLPLFFFLFSGFGFEGGVVGVYDTVLFEFTTWRHGLRDTQDVSVLGNSTCGGHSDALSFEFRREFWPRWLLTNALSRSLRENFDHEYAYVGSTPKLSRRTVKKSKTKAFTSTCVNLSDGERTCSPPPSWHSTNFTLHLLIFTIIIVNFLIFFSFVYSFMNYFKLENRPHRIMYLPLDFLTHSTMKKVMNFGFNYENNTPLFGCFFTLLLWLMRPSIWDRNWLVNHIHNTRLWLYNNIQEIC